MFTEVLFKIAKTRETPNGHNEEIKTHLYNNLLNNIYNDIKGDGIKYAEWKKLDTKDELYDSINMRF